MSSLLEKSILAFDSYNRGYKTKIESSTSKIGGFEVLNDSSILLGDEGERLDQSVGFYATAYKNSVTNEIIISYRGTDSLLGTESFGSDIWNGYGVAFTSPLGKQAELAIKFYQSVQALNPEATISFTGHSLGGSLVGFIALVVCL